MRPQLYIVGHLEIQWCVLLSQRPIRRDCVRYYGKFSVCLQLFSYVAVLYFFSIELYIEKLQSISIALPDCSWADNHVILSLQIIPLRNPQYNRIKRRYQYFLKPQDILNLLTVPAETTDDRPTTVSKVPCLNVTLGLYCFDTNCQSTHLLLLLPRLPLNNCQIKGRELLLFFL